MTNIYQSCNLVHYCLLTFTYTYLKDIALLPSN